MKQYQTTPGKRYPFGIKVEKAGVNFSVFSRCASGIQLLLFERADSTEPFQVITLEPEIHRTFFVWHVFVKDLPNGVAYNWRVQGYEHDSGDARYQIDFQKSLSDPWAYGVYDGCWDRQLACQPGENHRASIRAIVTDREYDWEGDRPLHHATENAIIYELHVGGFTLHSSSKVKNPGTFSGLTEKIPYLKELGITHVELMPIMAFDTQDVPLGVRKRGLENYWGYSTHSFFAAHPGYCIDPSGTSQLNEFRDMVKALHKANISVILDVVFNHTAEGGLDGPTMNFKGFGKEMFYQLDQHSPKLYRDYTGCGNTVNANHPLVSRFILESLHFWVNEMHVDGFRFDLASALSRGEDGTPLYNAPILWGIEFSTTLIKTSLIAEAWDAIGLYQVGGFPGYRWQEWNGRYRDVMRRFVRGDKGLVSEVASRLTGSSDLYQHAGRLPINSINFITSHDGFTLYDLVSYNQKHNHDNGEDNRDGHNDNLSWNCGHEGETSDPRIEALRRRQVKNFMTILLLSHGVPMILAGDEVLRSQQGNNNAYCQNNDISWYNWGLTDINREMLRFTRELIVFRKRNSCLMRRRFLTGNTSPDQAIPDVSWHGYELNQPLWHDPDAHVLAYTLHAGAPDEPHLHIILNMSDKAHRFSLPEMFAWKRVINTGATPPRDITLSHQNKALKGHKITVSERSVVVMESVIQ